MIGTAPQKRDSPSDHENEFLLRYQQLFFGCLRLTAERDTARDLLHDAYVQFILTRPELDSIKDLNHYLMGIVRHLYISKLRRAHTQTKRHIPIAEFDSAEMALRNNRDVSAQLDAQQELIRICQYAFVRREDSREASVLILRYFLGYYVWEIARVLNSTESLVHNHLTIARRDIRHFLKEPALNRLVLAKLPSHLHELRVDTATGDFLRDLRDALLTPVADETASEPDLDELYFQSRAVNCRDLAHVVHCVRCLDAINNRKGLALLAERHGSDTIQQRAKPPKKGGRNGDPPEPPGESTSLTDVEVRELTSEVEDTRQHRPATLHVSANGFLIASQPVRSAVSELILTITISEPVIFIEIFSEQMVRLSSIYLEPISAGAPEKRQRVNLSDGRTLEVLVSFDDPSPTLSVRYDDPTFDALKHAENLAAPGPKLVPIFASRTQNERETNRSGRPSAWLTQWCEYLLRFPSLILPHSARLRTAVVALLLAVALVLYQMRPEIVSANELLDRASRAEQADDQNAAFVQHRSLTIDEFDYPSMARISHRRVEIWHSAEKQLSLRRLFDDSNQLLAEARFEVGKAPLIFRAPNSAVSGSILAGQNVLESQNIWMLDLASSSFASFISKPIGARVERSGERYVVNYQDPNAPALTASPLLVRGSLTLQKDTLHAVGEELVIREPNHAREFQIREGSFERLPNSSADPRVFDTVLAADVTRDATRPRRAPTRAASSSAKSVQEALLGLEIEALYRLNRIGPELENQIRVVRTDNRILEVQGTVDSEERKADILSALSPLGASPLLKTNIHTVSEALVMQSKDQPEPLVERGELDAKKGEIAVAPELAGYFKQQWNQQFGRTDVRMPAAWIPDRIREYSGAILGQSYRAYLHALALRNLKRELSAADIRSLDSFHRSQWDALDKSHAEAIALEIRAIRQELQPVFLHGVEDGHAGAPVDTAIESRAGGEEEPFEIIFERTLAIDETLVSAFTVSNQDSAAAVLSVRELGRTLKKLESLVEEFARH